MTNRELIVHLIEEDMRHCRLVDGMEDLGMDLYGAHSLRITNIVSLLMGIPKFKVSDGYFGLTVPPISEYWCHSKSHCNVS